MSVFCPRNSLSVVTTPLSSYALRNVLSEYSRPSCRPTMKKSSPCTRMYVSRSLWKKWHGDATPRENPPVSKNLSVMLYPSMGCVRRSVHHLSQFHTHTWLLCLRVFVCQSDVDVADRIGANKSGLDSHLQWISGKDPSLEKRLPGTKHWARFAKFAEEVLPRRSVRPLHGAPPYTTRRERYRGASALPLFVSLHLRPNGLRPVRARASASAEYSYTSTSHKYFNSFSRAVLTSRGSNGPPLTSSSASHSSRSCSSASTARMSSFGRDGRCCSGSKFPATPMIVWRTVDEWSSELSACATHPKFVNHLVNVFIPWGTFLAKQAPVSHCLERVWKPVSEMHNCWLFPTVCIMWACGKEMPTPVQLCFVQLANECQVQNPSCPFPLLTTRVNRWSNQQQRFRVLYQFFAFVPTVRFVEVQLPQIKSYRTAFILAFCLSEVSQKIVHTSTKPISVSFELSLLLLRLLLSAAWGASGSLRLVDSPCCSTVASVVSVSCSKLRFACGGGSSGGGAGGAGGNAEPLLLLLLSASPGGARGCSIRLQGDVSCAGASHPLVLWQPEQNDRVLAPVVRDLRWSSTRLLPCGNGIVLNDPPLVHDLLLRWHIRGKCLCSKPLEVSSAQWRSSYPSNFRRQWRQRDCRVWLQHRRSDPSSTAIIFQCVWCQFTAKRLVQQGAGPSFAWRQSFDCSRLQHSTCGANKQRVWSIQWPQVPSLFKSWIQRAQTTVGWLQRHPPHSLNELCQGENSAPSHVSFVCCLAVSTHRKPTVHAYAGSAYGTRHVNKSWSAGTSTLEADSTATLIDLTCPLTTFTELSAVPLDRRSPSADFFCTTSPVQANFTALSCARMEGSLSKSKHHSVVTQRVQIFDDHLHHLLATWEGDFFCKNEVSKNWLGHSIMHHQNPTVSTLVHLRLSGTVSGSKDAVIPWYDWDLRTILKHFAAFTLVSLGSTTPLDTSCTPWPKTCMPCQHMVLNFPGRWIWRFLRRGSRSSSPPTDSASLTPLWATSSPISTSSGPRADIHRSLWRDPWYLRTRISSA